MCKGMENMTANEGRATVRSIMRGANRIEAIRQLESAEIELMRATDAFMVASDKFYYCLDTGDAKGFEAAKIERDRLYEEQRAAVEKANKIRDYAMNL